MLTIFEVSPSKVKIAYVEYTDNAMIPTMITDRGMSIMLGVRTGSRNVSVC